MTLSESERAILRAVQHGLPLTRTPYRDAAAAAGVSTDELLATLRRWQADGRIRRVGAVVNHFQVGCGAGAMVAWCVPPDKMTDAGERFAALDRVSHVYQRAAGEHWPYTLYTMVHAAADAALREQVDAMSAQSGITEYRLLKTVRELKKVPPTYITEARQHGPAARVLRQEPVPSLSKGTDITLKRKRPDADNPGWHQS